MTFCELCWRDFPNIKTHKRSPVHLRGQIIKCPGCVVERWFSSKCAKARHLAEKSCLTTKKFRCLAKEFRCCDCGIDFATEELLGKHTQDETLHPSRKIVALSESDGYCEECNRVFKTKAGLATHLASIIHNPIMEPMKCLGGASCKRSFVTPSGMLAHLESGSCCSKLNRDLIDDLVIANDPTNIITDPFAVETRARDRMSLASSEYSTSTDGSMMFTPSEASIGYSDSSFEDWSHIHTTSNKSDGTITPRFCRGSTSDSGSSDTDSQRFRFMPSSSTVGHPYLQTPSVSGGSGSGIYLTRSESGDSSSGVYLTPSESGNPGSGVYLTPSESGDSSSGVYLTYSESSDFRSDVYLTPSNTNGSGIFTSTESVTSQLQPTTPRCPLCPPEKKIQFKDISALHTHMRSKVHAAKIYHCPLSITLGNNDSETRKKKRQKSFTTLSGLAQHVEAGACEGGRATFNTAIAFVNERLKGMGMEDMKVIGE